MISSFDQTIILFAIAAFIIVLLSSWIAYIHFRFNRLMQNAYKDNLEKNLTDIYTFLEKNHGQNKEIISHLRVLDRKINTAPRGLGLVLFKAFDGMKSGGGNSFALALLNEKGDGTVVSTLHSRERVNVYAKEIKNFTCGVLMTEEEQQALTKAQNSLSL
jgi:hypothetical protein